QRRGRPHHSGRQAGRRLPLRQDHAGDAGVGAEPAAAAAARRPARRPLHPPCRRPGPGRLGRPLRPDPLPGCPGGRHPPCAPPPRRPGLPSASLPPRARRRLFIRPPAVLEKVDPCRPAIFDKTGPLTYGRPELTELLPAAGWEGPDVLALVASLERYSKHPL